MKLFEPIDIKGMSLKNRIAFPPYLHQPSGEGPGGVVDQTVEWFETIARGGAGLIITGAVSPMARLFGLSLGDDSCIPGFARLAEVIHAHDAKIGVQIAAGGPLVGLGWSPLPYPDERRAKERVLAIMGQGPMEFGGTVPVREITPEEAELVQDAMAAAAVRAREAGIDCILLHCAHGGATLHCSSISPFYNRRDDKYGGSWEKRLTFATETLQKIRKAVGDDYPIYVRMNATDLLGERGTMVEDACKYVAPALERAGADCLDVSQGSIIHSTHGITIPLYFPRGCFIEHAAAVKKVTTLPVIGVGRIVDMEMANQFIEEGKADIIYMGRQLIADPDTPKKFLEGKTEDILKCIGCLQGCGPCAVNYELPQSNPLPLTPAEKAKRVLIIGGGVSGMEAARVATLRGHRVTLMEKESELGGMVAALSIDPLLKEFKNIVDYLGIQLRKLKVDVRVCREATPEDVEEINPDAVIIAAGLPLTLPDVAQGKPRVMTHIEALKKKREIGQRVVVWGLMGQELAVSLAEEGKDVVLLAQGSEDTLVTIPGRYVTRGARRLYILKRLTDIDFPRVTPEEEKLPNASVMFDVRIREISGNGIRLVQKEKGETVIPYDTLIISFGRRRDDSLYEQIKDKVPEVHRIGDFLRAVNINHAITTANEVARKI